MAAFKNAFFLILCLLVLFMAIPAGSPWAQIKMAGEDFDRGDYYELVLQVVREKKILSSSLLGFQKGYDEFYLPVGDLANILKIKADIDLENGTVKGWYLQESYPFEIDAVNGFYSIRGEVVDLAPGDVFVRELQAGFGDIYVRYEILNQILPLEMELDFSKLQLWINTEERLPYEKIALRKERRETLLARQNAAGIDTTGFKRIENPYKMFTKPVLNLSTSAQWTRDGEISNNTNITGTSDLLGFSADYGLNFGYDENGFEVPEILRMTLTKRAYDEPMPLGIRELKLGDVSAPTPTLVRGANSGRGVSISSRPVSRQGVFDEIIVEGYAQPGWEVELYRGSELLTFGTVNDDGYYRFENVQLLSGGNNIKVMLYGPQGQVEERIERHSIGTLLRPGEIEYNASVVDPSSALIEIDREDRNTLTQDRDQGLAYSGSADIGVNRWLSLFATGSNVATRDGKKKYATAGANLSLGDVRGHIEALKEIGGGHALDTRLVTRILGWRMNLKTKFLKDFESDGAGYGDNATVFDFDGSIGRKFDTALGRLNVRGSVNHEEEKDETSLTRYRLNTSVAAKRQSYGNRITARYRNHELKSVDGLLNARHRFNRKLSLRTRLGYELRPIFEFRDVSADLNYRHSRDLNMGVNVSQGLQTDRTTVGTNINYDFGKFLGSFNTRWTRGEGVDFTVRASTSLAPYGPGGKYLMSSDSFKDQSALNSRIFLDRNLNTVFDENDMPLENTALLMNNREDGISDEYGIARNYYRGRGEYVALTLDEESTQNPFYASFYPGYEVLMRPGVRKQLDFAVVETGVIDGTAYFEDGRPVPGLRLQLVDGEGTVLKEVLTFFDGYYTFEFVKPGSYIIRADPALNVHVPPRIITISPDALFAYGANVKLFKGGGLPSSQIDVDADKVRKNMVPILSKLVQLQSKLRGAGGT